MNVRDLVRPHLLGIKAYSSARDEYDGHEGVFLDANENPFDDAHDWNRYPDPYQRELKSAIASVKEVGVENIFIGLGSDEPIDLLIRAFCEPGKDGILILPPTYGMYKVSADIQNVKVEEALLRENFQLDLQVIERKLNKATKIVFVCSPNNPTGNTMNREDIEKLLEIAPGLVVVDEAYIDFTTEPSWTKSLEHHQNLVVLHTLSKAWGLASIRLGMAFANEQVIKMLNHIKPPYNVPGPVQQLALEAINNHQDAKKSEVAHVLQERERLSPKLKELNGVLEVIPSETNFFLVRFENGKSVFDELINRKVVVRDRSKQPLCDGCLRLTIGTRAENDRLLTELENILS